MNARCSRTTLGTALIATFLAGCAQQKMTLEDMKKMPPTPRPAELSKLEPLVGNWTYAAECTMPGIDKPISGTGKGTVAWACGGRVLVENMEFDMPEMGENGKMTGMAMYMYNPREKEFETFWTSSMGDASHGEMCYDEKTSTWHFKGKGRDPMTGELKQMRGTMKLVDANSAEWTHEEWDMWGMKKMMSMKGTSKKQ